MIEMFNSDGDRCMVEREQLAIMRAAGWKTADALAEEPVAPKKK
jgi:hypothetical protein